MATNNREYARKHYRENKRSYLDRNIRRRWEKRLWLIGYKDRPCADCKQRFPYYVMDLDHRDRSKKLHEVSELASRGSWTKLKSEVEKCDVVCANCHRARTFRDEKLMPVYRSRGEMPELAAHGLDVLTRLDRLATHVQPVTKQ